MRKGIVYGLPINEYHQGGNEISNTAISAACRSMAHYKAYTEEGSDIGAKVAQDGNLIHCAILEPDQFAKRYVVAPKCDKRTKAGKEEWETFCANHQGMECITLEQYAMAMTAGENVRRSGFFSDYMNGGVPEVSIFWNDSESGLDCRCRPDWINGDTIVDVKSTDDARQFQSSVIKYGYHRQNSFYLEGSKATSLNIKRFIFLVVERSTPNIFMVYELDTDLIDAGYRQWRQAINDISMASFTGIYGGYSDQIQIIDKPGWML